MSEIKVNTLRGLGVSNTGPAISLNSTGTFSFDSGTLFVDSTNNRVGINITNPAYTIDVNGAINVTGQTRISTVNENIEYRSSGQSGNQDYNFNTAGIFYHPSVNGDITARFTNVPTEQNRAYGFCIIFNQGGSARRVNTTIQINGTNYTTRWLGGQSPTITAKRPEVFNFSIVYNNGSWLVLGQCSSFN